MTTEALDSAIELAGIVIRHRNSRPIPCKSVSGFSKSNI